MILRKNFLLILIIYLFSFINLFSQTSQTTEVSGTVTDAKTNKPLEFVTVKVADTSYGTTADKNGKYLIRLNPGGHKLIFSYIGYFTDTSNVYVENEKIERNIFLNPSELLTEQIDVYGEDPAYEIIRKAIKYKKKFKQTLNEYEYNAYSKFVIRSNQSDIPKKDIEKDSSGKSKLPIFGILESETKGYFKKPDIEKQIVTAKRETANIARGFALPFVVNFYDEDLDFNEFKIPTPLADNAFDNYEYKLTGTTSMDSTRIFMIDVINSSENRPLLAGTIYIADSIFSLMRVDLTTNDAAKPLGVSKVNFKQKFSPYTDKNNLYWMPTDVEITANGTFAGIVKFEADVFTIVSDYKLNKKAPAGVFDDYIVKVMPDAKKDSSYWKDKQLVKNTSEEKNAYRIIESETRKNENSIHIGLTSVNYGKKFTSNPLNYYRFNRVEGSSLNFDLNYRSKFGKVILNSEIGYGFSDKKLKYDLNYRQRFLNDGRLTINAGLFRKLQPLSYPDLLGISELYNTVKALFDKQDNLDYYYASGYNLGIKYRLLPQIRMGADFTQEKQTTAYKNTNFSFRKKDVEFNPNPSINDAFQRVIGFNLRLDPNKYSAIDWGDGDVSRFRNTSYPTLDLDFKYSGKDLNSAYEYRKFSAELSGQNYINTFLNLRYKLGGELATGQVPFQSLCFFNTNSGTIDVSGGFKALKYQEFLGDRIFYLNFENNFGKILWGGIPFISKWNLIGFFNAGRNEITQSNYDLASYKGFSISEGIYMETGFSVSRILDIFRVDLAWRLNNKGSDGNKVYLNLTLDSF